MFLRCIEKPGNFRRDTALSAVLKGFLGIFVIGIIVSAMTKEEDAAGAPGAAQTTKAQRNSSSNEAMQKLMPIEQAEVIGAVMTARRQYAQGANEMAKGAARPARGAAICAALRSHSVDSWVGRISNLSSNSDGKGVLAIEIGPNIRLKTWNNSLSDMSDQTLIDPKSSIFRDASALQVGRAVYLSGYLIQDANDCIKESSMSLAGSIREPEFIMRFRSIRPIDY